ncbi:EcsC family protein [Naumannella huperziae]
MASVGRTLAQNLTAERTTEVAGGALRRVLELAIDGIGVLPGARTAAGRHLERVGQAEGAIDGVISQHVALAGAQGFATNVGGMLTLPISIPTNLTGLAVLQTRMVAGVAHLRGYDLEKGQVRTALLMCLLGADSLERAEESIPRRPMIVATAPVFDPRLDRKIATLVVGHLSTRVTGKQAALMFTKRVPVLGGGVGAAVDGWETRATGLFAKQELVARRAIPS